MKKFLIAAATTAVMVIGQANAAALIDLTKRAVGAGTDGDMDGILAFDGVPSPTPDPFQIKKNLITVTFTGDPDGINADQADEGGGAFCMPVGDFACDTDGLGIGDDEITQSRSEQIIVTFSLPVIITNIYYLDLFEKRVFDPMLTEAEQTESAKVSFFTNDDDVAPVDTRETFATSNKSVDPRGFVDAVDEGGAFLLGPVTKLIFTAGDGLDDLLADFALAGIEFKAAPGLTEIPVPGALPLFLAGLGGMAFARRRRSS